MPSVGSGLVGGSLGSTLGGGHSHNGHLPKAEQLQVGQLAQQQQPSVQAAAAVAAAAAAAAANPSPLAQSLAPAAAAAQNALVAAMQQNALKQAQLAAQAAQAAAAQERAQNAASSQSLSAAASMASHESNSNASTPLRQTDSPMSQQNRKRRRKSASSEKGSGDEGSGVDSGAEDNLDETRGGASDDESGGEEAEFEPSKLLEQSMTEVRQGAGHQDNNSSSSDNLQKEDIKPAITFDASAPNALAGLNTQDPTAVLAFAAAAQAAQGASGGSGDSVAGPSQPTHGMLSQAARSSNVACSPAASCMRGDRVPCGRHGVAFP